MIPRASQLTVGTANWIGLERAGWAWEANLPTGKEAAEEVDRLRGIYGHDNVATGFAWDGHMPKGITGQVGIYVRSPRNRTKETAA
jgi:hypothetical protein